MTSISCFIFRCKLLHMLRSLEKPLILIAYSASLPMLARILCLWAVLFFGYAIAFVQVFGLTKVGNNSTSRFANYRTWGNALSSLATASTGEAWNANMHDFMVEYPRCVEGKSYLSSDCGSQAWALGLFGTWNLISMYAVLQDIFYPCSSLTCLSLLC